MMICIYIYIIKSYELYVYNQPIVAVVFMIFPLSPLAPLAASAGVCVFSQPAENTMADGANSVAAKAGGAIDSCLLKTRQSQLFFNRLAESKLAYLSSFL